MNKIMRALNWLLIWILNLALLAGLAILIAWFFWDIKPQESLTKTAQFFSTSWHRISAPANNGSENISATSKPSKESTSKNASDSVN